MTIHWESGTFIEHVLLLYCIVCFFIGQTWWVTRAVNRAMKALKSARDEPPKEAA
jgi:hypothetical protein